MDKAADTSKDIIEGASYKTIFYPGQTGLKFEKGRNIRVGGVFSATTDLVINSATVTGNRLSVLWTVSRLNDGIFDTPEIGEAVSAIRQHFESKNPGQSFSVERTDLLTAGATASTDLGEGIKNIAKDAAGAVDKLIPDLGDLSSKLGIALIVLAVSLGLFAAYKAFSGPSSSKAGI